MLGSTKYYGLNTLNEYLSACSFASEYVASSPATNQFSYETATNSIHMITNGDVSRFFQINTNQLKIGDVIEIEVEIANMSNGDNGKIVVVDNNNVSNYYQLLSTNNTNRFKKLKYSHVVQQNTNYRVGVGVSGGTTGEIKLRNFHVKVYSSLELKDRQKVVIEGNNTFASKFSVRTDFSSDPVKITNSTDGIVVNWDIPFTTTKRPVPSVAMDYVGNSPKYIVRVGGVTNTGFSLKFYDLTGAVVNVADLDLTNSIFVYITCTV